MELEGLLLSLSRKNGEPDFFPVSLSLSAHSFPSICLDKVLFMLLLFEVQSQPQDHY
jgi:hypothetical protein